MQTAHFPTGSWTNKEDAILSPGKYEEEKEKDVEEGEES